MKKDFFYNLLDHKVMSCALNIPKSKDIRFTAEKFQILTFETTAKWPFSYHNICRFIFCQSINQLIN